MAKPTDRANRGQHARRRAELERLLDRTVLGPTDPEFGTYWRFTGTATPYGRMAKAQDSYTHRATARRQTSNRKPPSPQ